MPNENIEAKSLTNVFTYDICFIHIQESFRNKNSCDGIEKIVCRQICFRFLSMGHCCNFSNHFVFLGQYKKLQIMFNYCVIFGQV